MRFFSPAGFEAFLVADAFARSRPDQKKSRRQKPGNGTLTE